MLPNHSLSVQTPAKSENATTSTPTTTTVSSRGRGRRRRGAVRVRGDELGRRLHLGGYVARSGRHGQRLHDHGTARDLGGPHDRRQQLLEAVGDRLLLHGGET